MKFNILSLFPEFFSSPLDTSLMARAIDASLIDFTFYNPRDFSIDRHQHVDDKPFGGGPGMVMTLQPLCSALSAIDKPGRILLMSPSGKKFDQHMAEELAAEENLSIICGRYEGIDSRLGEFFPIEEISLCDAVLNGGEAAAWAVVEAVCRFIPGFLGKEESTSEESFSENLLEYPHYTRPEIFLGKAAPQVLLGGDHGRVARWRRDQSLLKTLRKRPGLLARARLDCQDAAFLASIPRLRHGRAISFCLCHYPVYLDQRRIGTSSLTNLDIHDIARISRTYGMGPFYALTPLGDQLELLRSILRYWRNTNENADRSRALELVRPVASYEDLLKDAADHYGREPKLIATSANWPGKTAPLSPEDVLELSGEEPVIICLGTAKGLAVENMGIDCLAMRPIRFADENHLSVRSAAAILADRILGDFH